VADTFAGRIHVEWDNSAQVTPLGQLPFFVEFVKQGGLFDGMVADCPLHYTSPNAPKKRDVLGTIFLSVLAGHWRYAHMTTVRCDAVNPPLLGMTEVVCEDAVRRGLDKIDEKAGETWLQGHFDYTSRPLLNEPWILDIDTTVKPLYGHQQGAVVSYNPQKPGRPSQMHTLDHKGLAVEGRRPARPAGSVLKHGRKRMHPIPAPVLALPDGAVVVASKSSHPRLFGRRSRNSTPWIILDSCWPPIVFWTTFN